MPFGPVLLLRLLWLDGLRVVSGKLRVRFRRGGTRVAGLRSLTPQRPSRGQGQGEKRQKHQSPHLFTPCKWFPAPLWRNDNPPNGEDCFRLQVALLSPFSWQNPAPLYCS